MKKNLLILTIIFSSFFVFNISFADCNFSSGATVSGSLFSCFSDSKTTIVTTNENLWVEDSWFKKIISKWIINISILLSLVAVMYIVVGSLEMVLSAWSDEKIKKGKNIIKWAIVWFLALISAGSIITLVINYMFR